MERSDINAIGTLLASLRMPEEGDVLIGFGAHGPSPDCRNGHVSATVRRGRDEFIGEAVSLHDAMLIARGRLNEMVKRREAEAAKEKAPSDPKGHSDE